MVGFLVDFRDFSSELVRDYSSIFAILLRFSQVPIGEPDFSHLLVDFRVLIFRGFYRPNWFAITNPDEKTREMTKNREK